MRTQRILVVDDDKEAVRLMRAYLEQAQYEVLVAYDGETAVHILRRDKPDLLLLDLMLPGMDGWQVTRIVRSDANLAHIPIIMLTARVDDTEKIVGLELGADDYVTKPYNPREVVARVRARLRSNEAYQAQVLKVGELAMDVGRREVMVNGRVVDLTPSEFALLQALLEQAGYVLTRSQLLRLGLGENYEGIERTLDSHMRNLRRKIEPDPKNPRYIQTVYGVGYRLEDKQ
jgi:two-component system, OmpR family, alkaline phosphatase synthesis response regulator PhoP